MSGSGGTGVALRSRLRQRHLELHAASSGARMGGAWMLFSSVAPCCPDFQRIQITIPPISLEKRCLFGLRVSFAVTWLSSDVLT